MDRYYPVNQSGGLGGLRLDEAFAELESAASSRCVRLPLHFLVAHEIGKDEVRPIDTGIYYPRLIAATVYSIAGMHDRSA